MPRPNWFLAFPFDGAFVSELHDVPPCVRRFPAEDVHLTLSFFGGCGEEKALRALAVLDELLAKEVVSPIEVSLGEVVPLGGSKRDYTALSALLSNGRGETKPPRVASKSARRRRTSRSRGPSSARRTRIDSAG
jgi:hypothetical protein